MQKLAMALLFAAIAGRALAGATGEEDSEVGQTPAATGAKTPKPTALAPAPIKLGSVSLTGTLRARVYAWNWFDAPGYDNQYAHSGNILRLNFAQTIGKFDWDAEFAVPLLLGLPAKATAPAPQGALGLGSNYYAGAGQRNSAMIFPKQLFARVRGAAGDGKQALKVGRFLFLDGSELAPKNATLATLKQTRIAQRLIGDFGWTDVGRSFDGVHYTVTKPTTDFTFVSGVPTRGVFQTDGWGWNRVAFGYGALTQQWGKGNHSADTRFFVIEYHDWRHILKTDSLPVAVRRGDLDNIRIETFGGHSVHAISTKGGTIDLLAWGAVQTGRWGTQSHRAYAFNFEGGFQPKILPKLKPWIRGGYIQGSGDGNPNDQKHGTFFQLLPTPRPYARFPFFNMMNTEDAFLSLILRPHPKVTVSHETHFLRLTDANDLWYSGGGAYQPWTFGYAGRSTSGRRSLANLYDVNVEYRASRAVTVTGYLGYAQGLASINRIYPTGTKGQFGYVEFLYRF